MDDLPTFEAPEFDSSSDEEPEEDLATGSTGTENDAGLLALAPEANFLLGAVSRFVRSIRFNNRIAI